MQAINGKRLTPGLPVLPQFHGLDGLGDVPATFPAYSDLKLAAAPGHAAVHLAHAVGVCCCAAAYFFLVASRTLALT
jgi:hypothetical protein